MTVTLKDIAQRANVSIKTVSNVIRQKSNHYSDATYDQVMAAASELGYVPNSAARHLRRGKVGLLALVVPDLLNPYFGEISQEIVLSADEHNYNVLIDFTNGSRKKELNIVNGGRPLAVDGIILDAVSLNEEDIDPKRVGLPMTLIGERLLNTPYDHVMIDNIAAAREATSHLIQLGRRRIAPIGVTSPDHIGMPNMRYQGFCEAMTDAGLPVEPELVIRHPLTFFDRRRGVDTMLELLKLDNPPDAILCFNDLIAFGAMRVLRQAGIGIPDDVAVVGFDDIQECRYSLPPLTSVSPKKGELGRIAVSLLLERVNGKRTGSPEIVIAPHDISIRESTVK